MSDFLQNFNVTSNTIINGGIGSVIAKGALIDVLRSNTIIYADDPNFFISIGTGEQWYIQMNLFSNGTPSQGGIKYRINAPIGSTGSITGVNGAAGDNFYSNTFGSTLFEDANPFACFLIIITVTAGSSGNLTLQWAQSVSDPLETIISKGSNLMAVRIK